MVLVTLILARMGGASVPPVLLTDRSATVNDLGIFVDYSICLNMHGRIEVTNLCDGNIRSFYDIVSAVDFADSHTNTLSPRYPSGYRSNAVRTLETLGMSLKAALMCMVPSEEIIFSGGDLAEPPEQLLPEVELRNTAGSYMLEALGADNDSISCAWIDRALDIYTQANEVESSRERQREYDKVGKPGTDAYRYVGRGIGTIAERKRDHNETLASDRNCL